MCFFYSLDSLIKLADFHELTSLNVDIIFRDIYLALRHEREPVRPDVHEPGDRWRQEEARPGDADPWGNCFNSHFNHDRYLYKMVELYLGHLTSYQIHCFSLVFII